MHNICLVCNNKKYPICGKCSGNPFSVEKCRQKLAALNDLETLRTTYNHEYAQIKNLNSSSFWDKKLQQRESFKEQDEMTKDRVKTAFKFFPKSSRKVLDIGAGNGFIEELLNKNKDLQIFGNDISYNAVQNLKREFRGKFRRESIFRMKYLKRYFDAIFVLEVLEHISPSKIFSVLSKIKNFLKDGGSLVVSIPTNEGLEKMKTNPSGHVRTYTENLIRAELKIAGFKVLKVKTLFAFKDWYAVKKITSNLLKNKWKSNNIVILAKPI